ncbi:MAG TPA: TonB-dependent receptor [Flavitalea sp.]|nr:TonB-dependent receptor [Flavitalea sp.]
MKAIGFLFAVILASAAAYGQTISPDQDSAINAVVLQDVIVTTNRLELRKKQVPQKLEIITAKDLAMSPGLDVGDIVKKMAALDVIQRPGVATYASIRGFRPPAEPGRINPEVSVLLNGRQSGTQNLALFDPGSIERIEVLKGAAGAIYGSSTMGGIINIITKQTRGKVRGSVFGGYGSFQTSEMGYAVGGNILPKLDFDFSGTFFDRNQAFKIGDGNFFRKILGSEQVELFPASGTVKEYDTAYDGRKRNGTKMGYRSNSLRVGYQISDSWRVDISGHSFSGRGIESSGDLRLIDAAQGYANRFYHNGDISITGHIRKHSLSLKAFLTHEENSIFNNYNGSTFSLLTLTPSPTYQTSEGIVKWKGFQLQDAIKVNEQVRILAGLDYSEASSKTRSWNQANADGGFEVTARSPYSPYSFVKTLAPFAQAHIAALKGRFIVNPGIRYDFIRFGILETPLFLNLTPKKADNAFLSPSLALQYNLNSDWAIHTNIGRAFRFAQAFEMAGYIENYFPGNTVRINTGNADLKNEESVTGDIGVKYSDNKSGLSFDAVYFNTRVTNRIRQVSVPERVGQTHTNGMTIDQYLTYDNADEAKIEGLELQGSYDFGSLSNNKYRLRVFASLTHLIKAEDHINGKGLIADAVVRIRNVAPLNMGYGIEYDNLRFFSARLSGRYMSRRYSQDFGHLDPALRGAYMEFPKYMILDLTVNYTIAGQHVLSLRIGNLTDENYYETRGFNLPGRFTGVRYAYRF